MALRDQANTRINERLYQSRQLPIDESNKSLRSYSWFRPKLYIEPDLHEEVNHQPGVVQEDCESEMEQLHAEILRRRPRSERWTSDCVVSTHIKSFSSVLTPQSDQSML